jgi:hypothetical protein
MATTYREFYFRHDDFHLDGVFCICEPLLIEASNGLRGFKIESVQRLVAADHAVPVPTVISDYVEAWALTDAGKARLQKALDDQPATDGQSYAYTAPRDHRSIWAGRAA